MLTGTVILALSRTQDPEFGRHLVVRLDIGFRQIIADWHVPPDIEVPRQALRAYARLLSQEGILGPQE